MHRSSQLWTGYMFESMFCLLLWTNMSLWWIWNEWYLLQMLYLQFNLQFKLLNNTLCYVSDSLANCTFIQYGECKAKAYCKAPFCWCYAYIPTIFKNMFFAVSVYENDDRGDGESCRCLPPCKETNYKTELSHMAYPSDKAGQTLQTLSGRDATYMK